MMATKAVFEGLVFDDLDRQLEIAFVGSDACYVINDDGFLRHIPAENIDRQVLDAMRGQAEENKELIAEKTINMIGDVDLFTHGLIKNQLENLDNQFNHLMQHGIPEDSRIYLGLLGFKIIVDYHGDVIQIEQPAAPAMDED
jgi:hypothetical protein